MAVFGWLMFCVVTLYLSFIYLLVLFNPFHPFSIKKFSTLLGWIFWTGLIGYMWYTAITAAPFVYTGI